jgi:hypothetical protein
MIKASEFRDWLNSPVTKAVIARLEEVKKDRIEHLLNLSRNSYEELAIEYQAVRCQLNGLGEFLDLDSLAESMGVTNED